MLWRDGDKVYLEQGWNSCTIDLSHCSLERGVDQFLSFLYLQSHAPRHAYQSFLLDYIEYLFESAIDRQLAYEELDEQQRSWVRHHQMNQDMYEWHLQNDARPTCILKDFPSLTGGAPALDRPHLHGG